MSAGLPCNFAGLPFRCRAGMVRAWQTIRMTHGNSRQAGLLPILISGR